jgi:hypothetical protein
MEATHSAEMSAFTRLKRRHIPEDVILQLLESPSVRSVSYQRKCCRSLCIPIISWQRLGKDVLTAKSKCWRRCFLFGPLRIKERRWLYITTTSCYLIGSVTRKRMHHLAVPYKYAIYWSCVQLPCRTCDKVAFNYWRNLLFSGIIYSALRSYPLTWYISVFNRPRFENVVVESVY